MPKTVDWEDLPHLDYTSTNPARSDMLREQVYARRWKELMADDGGVLAAPNEQFGRVLRNLTWVISARSAKVASSLITWLGTNLGYAFLSKADELAKTKFLYRHEAYLSTWALTNVRRPGINGGIRALEFIFFTPEELRSVPGDIATLTSDDLEVAEHVVLWLASEDGQEFIQGCRAEIEHLEYKARQTALELE